MTDSPHFQMQAGCRCGAVRFELNGPILRMLECHCTDCQKLGGGAAAFLTVVQYNDVMFLKGVTSFFVTQGDSGSHVYRGYCAACGSPTYSRLQAAPTLLLIKPGAYDSRPGFKSDYAIWVKSAPPWHIIPDDIPQYPGNKT